METSVRRGKFRAIRAKRGAPVAGKLAGLATRSSARLVRHGNSCLYKHMACSSNAAPGSEETGRLTITSRKVVGIGPQRSLDLAGAFLQDVHLRCPNSVQLTLEVIGSAPLSSVMNALAFCNRSLGETAWRLAFVPLVRVFVYREPEKMVSHLRRSLRIQLRAVPLHAVEAAKERRDAGVIDVVRVRADTDLRRLSGLVNSRFRLAALGLEETRRSCRRFEPFSFYFF